jgi:tetratricopeptide (TPR) repeat protein
MVLAAASAAQSANRSKVALDFAVAALKGGDVAEAQRLLRERLAEDGRDSGALAKLAEIALDQRRIDDATVLLRRAAVADPTPARRLALVRHLQAFAGPAATLKEIEDLPQPLRNSFDVRAIEAAALGVLGVHDRQIAIYRELVRQQPNAPALWKTLGDALKTVGRLDEAVAALRHAIAARPAYGEAWWTLANFKSFRFTDDDLAAMRKALRQKPAREDALHFHFALGKAYEDRNQYERSFRHYADGNRLRAERLKPELMYVTRFVDLDVATFTGELFDSRSGQGCKDEGPIFVLGLHRSGSTLVEQILASHPMIEGTTEITVMQQLWDRVGRIAASAGRGTFQEIARLNASELNDIGSEYLERTRAFRLTDRPYFVDKLPANWMNLGLIRLALPNARIVDARRHPMACGFSNFKQHYATGVAFAYSLDSIGRFYADYLRFMEHFDRVQPGAVHHVLNERLIDDPEGEVRRLLDFVGVPFDPACLEFHRNKRAVRTPSAEQVRRPINRDGVNYWRHYEPWLGPLKAALGSALDRWDRVPA